MVQNFALILILLWIPQALAQSFLWLYWLQTKEYRFDRFRILFESSEGRKRLDLHFILLKSAILLTTLYFAQFVLLALVVFLFLDFRLMVNLIKRSLRRPEFTLRAREIFATSVLLAGASSFAALYTDVTLSLLTGEVLMFLSPFLGILWTAPLVWQAKNREVQKAREILEKTRPVVIGITGSYGKTTTKDFLAHLLSQKYKTAKTTGSENTEFGIARKTIKYVVPGTKFYVVEMGAYRRGEIKKLAGIVRPDMAIITGIDPQHLALFGSIENIKRAKYELVESLPAGAPVVFNFSNSYCRELARWARREGHKVYGYKPTIFTNKKLFASLPGTHLLENLAGAVAAARLLGLSWQDIEKGIKTVELPPKTMSVSKKGKVTVIDDSWNATPKGFEAALKYLSSFSGKKAVVTPGIIELGPKTREVHRSLGRKLKAVDLVILTSREFEGFIREGMGKSEKLKIVENAKDLQSVLEEFTGEQAVLVEGRVPQSFWAVL